MQICFKFIFEVSTLRYDLEEISFSTLDAHTILGNTK